MTNKKNQLYFKEEGENKKEIIIFLHSKILANWTWNEQKNKFPNYHCIYIDLPNHGKSILNHGFSIKESVKIIKNFIEKYNNIRKVNIIGFGLGGQIAIELLSNYPELLNKVIVSGVEAKDKKDCKTKKESIINILDKTKVDYLNNKNPGFLAVAYLRHFDMEKSYYKLMKKACNELPQKTLKEISYESLNYSLNQKPKDPSKGKDLLICYGTKEDIRAQRSAYDIKLIYKNAKIIEIYKGVHLWNMKKEKLFNEIANDFLSGIPIKKYENTVKEN